MTIVVRGEVLTLHGRDAYLAIAPGKPLTGIVLTFPNQADANDAYCKQFRVIIQEVEPLERRDVARPVGTQSHQLLSRLGG